jgi:ATP/maltotriose-dependent transcriptional regulator MalT
MSFVAHHPSPERITKIAVPAHSGVLPRERLFQLLDRSRTRPAVRISSPAGSGETALVSSYVDAVQVVCLWYRVDASDDDPASFFHYFGLAVEAVKGNRRSGRSRRTQNNNSRGLFVLTDERLRYDCRR